MVRGRALQVIVGLLMVFVFVMLDRMPGLAICFLGIGIATVVIAALALKRQIDDGKSHVTEDPCVAIARTSSVAATEFVEISSSEDFLLEAQMIEELAAKTLEIEGLTKEVHMEIGGSRKPYIPPTYDLFD